MNPEGLLGTSVIDEFVNSYREAADQFGTTEAVMADLDMRVEIGQLSEEEALAVAGGLGLFPAEE